MIEIDIITYFDRLSAKWEKKIGLFLTLFVSLFLYALLIKFINLDFSDYFIIVYIILPLLIAITIVLVWLYSTNRFFIKFSDRIVAGIILIVDEEKERLVLSKIVKKVIHHINNSKEFSNVSLKLLPTNFCLTEKEVEKYHMNFKFMYDLIIRLFVEGGNYDSLEKIIIEKLSITFKPKGSVKSKRLFFNTVDLVEDMNLQVKSRDWEYTLLNSGIDKKKYFENLNQIFLYYLGFYGIYVDRFEDSLELMSPIFDLKKTQITIIKKGDKEISLKLEPYNLAEGRLATILVDLFFLAAIESYYNSETKKALGYFEKLETIVKKHPKKFEQLINMARYSYELSDLDRAINFTEEARKIKPKSVEVYLNLGFFAMLKNDTGEFCKNYRNIFEHGYGPSELNWVDVLAFQLGEKQLHKGKEAYFKFSTSFIEYIFIDQSKKNDFIQIIQSLKDNTDFKCLYELGEDIILNKVTKIETNQKKRNSTLKARSKKRKRK